MKATCIPLFLVKFIRIGESNQFVFQDWDSQACDVLPSAILIDSLPKYIKFQYSKTMKSWMISDVGSNPKFCTGLYDLNLEVWSTVTVSPFFPGVPLVEIGSMVFIDQSSIVFRFDLSAVQIIDPFIKVLGNDR